jgi:hypothetical protein
VHRYYTLAVVKDKGRVNRIAAQSVTPTANKETHAIVGQHNVGILLKRQIEFTCAVSLGVHIKLNKLISLHKKWAIVVNRAFRIVKIQCLKRFRKWFFCLNTTNNPASTIYEPCLLTGWWFTACTNVTWALKEAFPYRCTPLLHTVVTKTAIIVLSWRNWWYKSTQKAPILTSLCPTIFK